MKMRSADADKLQECAYDGYPSYYIEAFRQTCRHYRKGRNKVVKRVKMTNKNRAVGSWGK